MDNATAQLTITEFLKARLDEIERGAYGRRALVHAMTCDGFPAGDTESGYAESGSEIDNCNCGGPESALADVAAKRAIIEFHKQWPVLVEGPPEYETTGASGLGDLAFKMSQKIMWATEQEYRNRFGDEPPTGRMIRALASAYADHPDYREEWKL